MSTEFASTSAGSGQFILEPGQYKITGETSEVNYVIRNTIAVEWEVGTGTVINSQTLTRNSIIASSNNNQLVDFTDGQKTITINSSSTEIIVNLDKVDEATQEISEAVEKYVDDVIYTQKKYRSADSLPKYINSNNPKWAAESNAGLAWVTSVWEKAELILKEVTEGQRPIPTAEQVISELPEIVWPD